MQVATRLIIKIERASCQASEAEIEEMKQEALIEVGKMLLEQGLTFEELEQMEFVFEFSPIVGEPQTSASGASSKSELPYDLDE